MITNLLERETFVQQVRGAGVTQNVRAIVRQMATQSSNSKRDGAGGMARFHWPMKSTQQEKNKTRGALWAHHLQILEDGVSHLCGQWEVLNLLILRTPHADLFIGPVQIIQCQSTNLSDAQTVYRQKQNDGTVANMARRSELRLAIKRRTCSQLGLSGSPLIE